MKVYCENKKCVDEFEEECSREVITILKNKLCKNEEKDKDI